MIRRALAGAVCLLTCIAGIPALAQPAATGPTTASASDQSVITELEQLQIKLQSVHDLTTRFTQEKHTPLLRKPLVSTGEIRMIGQLMRWDTQKPTPSVMLIGENEIRLYYPRQKLMEVYSLDEQLARLAASPIPRIDVMKQHFDFVKLLPSDLLPGATESDFVAVGLTPRQETLKQHIQEVRLLVSRDSAYLRQMEMVDADGDRTVIRFDDVKLNGGLKAEDLELKPPAGTRISHPMSGENQQ